MTSALSTIGDLVVLGSAAAGIATRRARVGVIGVSAGFTVGATAHLFQPGTVRDEIVENLRKSFLVDAQFLGAALRRRDHLEGLPTGRGPRTMPIEAFLNQVDVAIRQSIPAVRGQRMSLQADITNFGNLLNKKWGQQRVAQNSSNSNVPLLTHRGMSTTDPSAAIPIVQFSPSTQEYIVSNFASNFWRFQLSARYSF